MHPVAIRKTSSMSKDAQKQHVAVVEQNPKAALAKRGISKKGKQMYYYKQGRKWRQKHASYLNGLPDEILVQIFKEVFTGVMMIDKTRLEHGDFRRKFGAQSLAFVNKKFKAIVESTMFEQCSFKLHHFRLHPKHHYTNNLATLPFIEDLEITWEPCANPRITTRQLHIDTIQSMVKLKVLTIDLKALSIQNINSGNGNVEFHGNIVKHLDSRADSMARWAKRLIFFGLTKYQVFLKYYFTVTTTALSNGLYSSHNNDQIRCATISCNSSSVVKVESIDRSTSRQVSTPFCKQEPFLGGLEGYKKFDRKVPGKFKQKYEEDNVVCIPVRK